MHACFDSLLYELMIQTPNYHLAMHAIANWILLVCFTESAFIFIDLLLSITTMFSLYDSVQPKFNFAFVEV